MFVTIFELYREVYEKQTGRPYKILYRQRSKKGNKEILRLEHRGRYVEATTGRRSYISNYTKLTGLKETMERVGHTSESTTVGYAFGEQQALVRKSTFGIKKLSQARMVDGTQDETPDGKAEEIRQINALLNEQRKSLLDSLKSDLPAYLTYKFEVVATEKQLDQIRVALLSLEKSPISESLFEPALKDGLYGYNWFFNEVIELIRCILHPAQVEYGVHSDQVKDGIDAIDLSALSE